MPGPELNLKYLISAILRHSCDSIVGQTLRSGMRSFFPCIKSEVLYCNLGSEVPEMTWASSEILVPAVSLYPLAEFLAGQGTHAIAALIALQNERRILSLL